MRNRVLLSGLALLSTAACTDLPTPADDPSGAEPRLRAAAAPRAVPQSLDDDFVRIAEKVPGFGGMFMDEAGEVHVHMKNPATGASARPVIEAFLAERARGAGAAMRAGSPIRFRQGAFEFRELRRWHDEQLPAVWNIPGVTFTDIDERQNRLVIAVRDGDAARRVRALVASLRVPAEAVVVEEFGQAEELVSLRDQVRPTPGGIGISFASNTPAGQLHDCTLGFNAYIGSPPDDVDSTVHVFVTNTHCTGVPGQNTGSNYYQGGQHIGTEYWDAGYFQGFDCPAGKWCRYGDAAIVRYNESFPWDFGYTALTAFAGTSSAGSLDITGRTRITSKAWMSPMVGQNLSKVGQRTGWTRGNVARTCANVQSNQRPDLGYVMYLCQDWVSAHADNGDSGSPVLNISQVGPYQTDAVLHGILWCGNSTRTEFCFSNMSNVQQPYVSLSVVP